MLANVPIGFIGGWFSAEAPDNQAELTREKADAAGIDLAEAAALRFNFSADGTSELERKMVEAGITADDAWDAINAEAQMTPNEAGFFGMLAGISGVIIIGVPMLISAFFLFAMAQVIDLFLAIEHNQRVEIAIEMATS